MMKSCLKKFIIACLSSLMLWNSSLAVPVLLSIRPGVLVFPGSFNGAGIELSWSVLYPLNSHYYKNSAALSTNYIACDITTGFFGKNNGNHIDDHDATYFGLDILWQHNLGNYETSLYYGIKTGFRTGTLASLDFGTLDVGTFIGYHFSEIGLVSLNYTYWIKGAHNITAGLGFYW